MSDGGSTSYYIYDHAGERVIKNSSQGETAYVNQFYTVRNGSIVTKHYFAGTSRVASKLQGSRYFYHPDHIGSTSYVTDDQGDVYEHIEYFPFGEAWVEERGSSEKLPYLFTGKELDEETGLYYYGARYYDPRTSVWQSMDPILNLYLPEQPKEKETLDQIGKNPLGYWNENLKGEGGVYQNKNLNLSSYAFQNPLKYIDPTGMASSAWANIGKVFLGTALGAPQYPWMILPFFIGLGPTLPILLLIANPTTWGFVFGIIDAAFGAEVEIDWFTGFTVTGSNFAPKKGGFSLGVGRFTNKVNTAGTPIKTSSTHRRHERGHSWQAAIFGPAYWVLIALPSAISYARGEKWIWPEKWADWWGHGN